MRWLAQREPIRRWQLLLIVLMCVLLFAWGLVGRLENGYFQEWHPPAPTHPATTTTERPTV